MRVRSPHRHAGEEDAAIDLAPLLDVVFILLIFFILTASFVHETAIGITPEPPVTAQAKHEERALVVTVAADDQVWADGQRIDLRLLRSHLQRLHALRPQASLVVRAHEDASTEVFATIADRAREAGVPDVALMTFSD